MGRLGHNLLGQVHLEGISGKPGCLSGHICIGNPAKSPLPLYDLVLKFTDLRVYSMNLGSYRSEPFANDAFLFAVVGDCVVICIFVASG